ncbi:Isocitrate dehydrogenase [NAD] subunit 1, mitochondrial [Wickerhamiella sorbophila]|uniref:Isocitrate dehydrogenase [NAD] subunit 1, mitochondrial n=1 Tax=Wickerhamiella sorbophila TaxID=45607 RepID=A0A2T0FFQ1_9ASCO|nr:Isocitrate dehydrogenase [NAD] subunit 1, mitochondrial [Wickerhamiella sorbophila]PRT53818.1 Isocitrate dehydrogenase [NAD] subunit 1, mitochondrial [Wickerhamiella sorbophila]
MLGSIYRKSVTGAARTTVRGMHFKTPNTKYGSKYTVTLIPGDGIGKETAEAVKTIFKADNVPVEFEEIDVTGEVSGSELPAEYQEGLRSLRRNKVGLKGILYTPVVRTGHPSFNVLLRKELDIFASVSLFKSIPGVQTRQKDIDFVVVRENTEGEYSGLEHMPTPDVVESLKIITEYNSERIGRFAFDFAVMNQRNRVTAIHKANIMKQADGLFRNTVKGLGTDYPQIEVNDMIVDNASMQAVSHPQQFDVLVTPNLYGTILSNIGAGLVGGPGLVPGVSIGRDYAVFEPGCRHVGLDIKGKNTANPTAMVLSSVMMLRHLGLDETADRISKATYKVLEQAQVRTPDLGGTNTTTEFTKAILNELD